MRQYRLVHSTRYDYESTVERSYGRAHLIPTDRPGQRCLSAELEITPHPADLAEHTDYFGNISTFYLVRQPHTSLTVTSRSELEIDRDQPPFDACTAGWEEVRDEVAADPLAAEFRLPSPRIRPMRDVDTYAAESFGAGRPVLDAVADLMHRIHRDFRYSSGATTVHSTIRQLLDGKQGVCQDFAHLAVAALRSRGLPARYVSGYLETQPPPGRPKLQGADASHAWASVHLGEHGWVDFDPTNDQWVDDRYLVAATGRDYSDVPPLKGIIVTGSTRSKLRVSVDVTPL